MQLTKTITAVVLLILSLGAYAQEQINSVRMWPAPDNTRLVFDVSGPVSHSLFTLANPDRIVIDVKNTSLAASLDGIIFDKSMLNGIRTAVRNKTDLRIVLDLNETARPKSFVLVPNKEYGHRLVIDLQKAGSSDKTVKRISPAEGGRRDVIIAIDAGHGGDDPGASGPHHTKEKDVVLQIARRLNTLVTQERGMQPVMIRDGDYYIGLRKRVEIAHQHRADMFVSIHADAFNDPSAKGSSVYTLSLRGASSEQASILAEKENAADLIGGVRLDDKDDLLASVLLDLSQTATIEASVDVASRILSGLKGVGKVHKSHVEQAGFRVLKSPDLPSILVETAFISNPTEERLLRTSNHQYQLAKAIMDGLHDYFHSNPPPGTLLASREQEQELTHTISRGDTLSGIARQYSVSLDTLRTANGLQDSNLRVGEVLRIPVGG